MLDPVQCYRWPAPEHIRHPDTRNNITDNKKQDMSLLREPAMYTSYPRRVPLTNLRRSPFVGIEKQMN
jgi:hypothetical protein